MVSFKKYLQENEDYLEKINKELNDLDEEELDVLGYVIYSEFFDVDEVENEDEVDFFSLEDIQIMIAELGPEFYEDVYDLIDTADDEDEMVEAVSRVFKKKNINRKKRKFMANSKAELRRTKASRKKDARASKAKRKRYYNANKVKAKNYQKTRAAAIKKGGHKVKLRRAAG